MKNTKIISDKSRTGTVKLYYSPSQKAVYDTPGEDRFYLTDLINYNSPNQVEETVNFFMSL